MRGTRNCRTGSRALLARIAFAAAVVTAPSAWAQAPAAGDFAKLHLCLDVYDQKMEHNEQYEYVFERNVYGVAGLDFAHDTKDSARAKIRAFWDNHQRELRCDMLDFPVEGGNILKYAAQKHFPAFLDAAGRMWKVDLDIVDPSDGKTVLDFVQDRIRLGMDQDGSFARYEAMLRRFGARRAADVPETEKQAQRDRFWRDTEFHALKGEPRAKADWAFRLMTGTDRARHAEGRRMADSLIAPLLAEQRYTLLESIALRFLPLDQAHALDIFEQMAGRGSHSVYGVVGHAFEFADAGVPANYPLAMQWYRRGSDDDGTSTASYRLGLAYETGKGVPKDERRAEFYYLRMKVTKPNPMTAPYKQYVADWLCRRGHRELCGMDPL